VKVPSSILTSLPVDEAISGELGYHPPYLPPSVINDAVKDRQHEAAKHLKARYKAGFDVPRAEILQVPKRRGGLRPVSALDFQSRILYRALEEQLASALPGLDRSWEAKQAFERAPLEADANYVVIADVAGFYDFIDHSMLEEELIAQTGDADVVELAVDLLNNLMGRQFGLPQVVHASNVFSEAFIDIAERRLLRGGFSVWRINDDFRLGTHTWRQANTAFEALDRVVRDLGLAINEHKSFILTSEKYAWWLAEPENRWNAINEEVELDLRFLASYADEGEEGAPRVTDSAVLEAAAVRALDLALDDPEAEDRLQEEVNRQLIAVSLRALRIAESAAALPRASELLNREPQLAAEIARYLTVAADIDETAVAKTCGGIVGNPRVHFSAWQALWLIEAIRALRVLPDRLGTWMSRLMAGEAPDAVRARAARALAEWTDVIDLDVISELYGTVAISSRPDIVAAAALTGESGDKRLNAIARDDPLNRWIIEAVTSRVE
jgi:hypothetical protein